MYAHGIMFHHFHNEHHPRAQGSLGVEGLRSMLLWLSARHHILPAEEFQSLAMEGRLRPEHICLTFDDSLRCQYDIAAPVLEELGHTAFWFVYTSPMQGVQERLEIYRFFRNTAFERVKDFYSFFFRHLEDTPYGELAAEALRRFDPATCMARAAVYSPDDCRFRHLRDDILGEEAYHEVMDGILEQRGFRSGELLKRLWIGPEDVMRLRRGGHIIGLHSHTHPTRIGAYPRQRQLTEYVENKRILEGIIGEEIISMSHPSNSYGEDTLDILRELGVRVGFRAFMSGGAGGLLELPRQDHANILREMERQ